LAAAALPQRPNRLFILGSLPLLSATFEEPYFSRRLAGPPEA